MSGVATTSRPRSAPTRQARRTQSRGDRTRAAIIDETVLCVLEEGFAAASAKHVAERAGVTWGVIQYHFGDRDALLMAVVDAGWNELRTNLAAIDVPDGPTRARVEVVVSAAWAAFSSPASMAALEILVATRSDRNASANRHLLHLARDLRQLGESIAPNTDPAHAAVIGDVLWAALRGLVLAQIVVRDQRDPSRELTAIVDMLSSYLAENNRTRRRSAAPRAKSGRA